MSTTSEIIKLSSDVIDQIAAGEVVERPSHLVKELVENSVDAGATEIEVEVDDGGKKLTVIDNGNGIQKEQLALALSRHATSKIRAADDLWKLSSFGFRGEALASAAAVSDLTITSKTSDADVAFCLNSKFGSISDVEESGGRQGTKISIESLFENVPARMKFLKSDAGEHSHIKLTLKALALSHPGITFRLKVKGKLVFFWSAVENQTERAQQILEVEKMYMASGELGGFTVNVAYAPPHVVFGNSRNIWLFVQNRWVQDRSVQAAVMEAFRGLLMHGEFPYAVVWLECAPDAVDVNVHPTKSQVKFENQRDVFRVVQRALRASLEQAPWVKEVVCGGASVSTPSPVIGKNTYAPAEESMSFAGGAFEQTQYPQKQFPDANQSSVQSALQKYSRTSLENSTESTSTYKKYNNYVPQNQKPHFYNNIDGDSESNESMEPRWSSLHLIGQGHQTYIICQNEEKILFVDQHAAHERVAYEKLMQAWKNGGSEIQNFLIPLSVDLTEEEAEAVMTVKDELHKMGVEIDQGGPTSILVRSAIGFLKEASIAKTISQLGYQIVEKGGSFAFENYISDLCATMACHSVIRAGQSMSREEMQALLVEMDQFPLSSFCPHGRPVFVEYPINKLERDFGRIG